MQILIIIGIGVIWLVYKVFSILSEGVSNVSTSIKDNQEYNNRREEKYSNRFIDTSKSLYDRNIDIISIFENKITIRTSSSYGGYRDYYIENETRDCLNEIALAENNKSVAPKQQYLSNWKSNASKDWLHLAQQIEELFRKKQKSLAEEVRIKQIADEERKRKFEIGNRLVRDTSDQLKLRISNRVDPVCIKNIQQKEALGVIFIEHLSNILTPDKDNWLQIRKKLLLPQFLFPVIDNAFEFEGGVKLNQDIEEFNRVVTQDNHVLIEIKNYFQNIINGYEKLNKSALLDYFNYVLDNISMPFFVPKKWNIDFDESEHIMVVEVALPDIVHTEVRKTVNLKGRVVFKPLNQKESREELPKIQPAIILRIAYEIFKNDTANSIKLLVINGWVEFDSPATGLKTKTYTASVTVNRDQIMGINLEKIDPVVAFSSLKGTSAGKLIDIIPIVPVLHLDRDDKRIIATKDLINNLATETNLASMDWQDFENLIAELFEKVYSGKGTEVKLTQSSRDKGVDAIVFDPDPIRGGKYVIQAKRYTNTVDVSAVRDLVAVVTHEGASKGILVTTSTFGADAYAFVKNKPITLLDGSQLLGLLGEYGYKFRINLEEAKKTNLTKN